MRYLITGATGFIGSHLIKKLSQSGAIAHALIRSTSCVSPELRQNANSIHSYDGSRDSLNQAIKATNPDVVVHLASCFVAEHKPEEIDQIITTNILFGTHLLESMKQLEQPRLINVGTSWQHFNDADYDPVCLYAASKQAFEDIIRFYVNASNFSVLTLKLFDTYGPGDKRNKLIPYLFKALDIENKLRLSPGEQKIDLVHIDDVLRAIHVSSEMLTVCEPGYRSYAVSSGKPVSLRELVRIFSGVVGQEPFIEWGARPYRAREVMVPWSSGEVVPNWHPAIELKSGLAGCVAQYRANNLQIPNPVPV